MEKFDIRKHYRKIDLLDKGFLELIDGPAEDPRTKIVNAARVSFLKETKDLRKRDIKLIDFMNDHGHYSVFRHSYFTFRWKAPLFVFRQAWKYQIASHWEEDGEVGGGGIVIPETNWNEACLEENTSIYCDRIWGGRRTFQRIKIGHLHKLWKTNPDRVKTERVRCWDEKTNEFTTGTIKDVIDRGIQKVWEITLSDGKKITCTGSHRILGENGWGTVNDLLSPTQTKNVTSFNDGVRVAVNGVRFAGNGRYQSYDWMKSQRDAGLSVKQIAYFAGCSYHTIRKWLKIHNLQFDQNNKELEFFRSYSGIVLPSKKKKTGQCYKFRPKFVDVIDIVYIGEKQCYDIEMAGANKNFVAEGIVVHNSGRYVKFEPEFYIPDAIRVQSKDNKQGSEGKLEELPNGEDPVKFYENRCMEQYDAYKYMVDAGAAKEQCRALLPQGLYTQCIWTCSLQTIMFVLHQRLKKDAQWEIKQFGIALRDLVQPIYEPLQLFDRVEI